MAKVKFVAGQHVAAQAGLHVDHFLADLAGVADHALRMLDPRQRIEQVGKHRHEHGGADHAGHQGQRDIAVHNTAETLFVVAGLTGHVIDWTSWEKAASLSQMQ